MVNTNTHKCIQNCSEESSHVKVEPLIDDGADFRIVRVELVVVLAVGVDEVCGGGTTFVHHKIAVNNDGNIVLRV